MRALKGKNPDTVPAQGQLFDAPKHGICQLRGKHATAVPLPAIEYEGCVNVPFVCPDCGELLRTDSWRRDAWERRASW